MPQRSFDAILRGRDLLEALHPDRESDAETDPRARALLEFEREREATRTWASQYLAWDAGTD